MKSHEIIDFVTSSVKNSYLFSENALKSLDNNYQCSAQLLLQAFISLENIKPYIFSDFKNKYLVEYYNCFVEFNNACLLNSDKDLITSQEFESLTELYEEVIERIKPVHGLFL